MRELSNNYLNDANKLGYSWKELVNKNTRQKVIIDITKYRIKKDYKKITFKHQRFLKARKPIKPIPAHRLKKEKPIPKVRTKIIQTNKALKGYTKSFEVSIKNRRDPLI